jgi:hypothetical protein
VTEADRGLASAPDSPWADFTPEDELRKAQLLPQSYVESFAMGTRRHFHFILGDYTEGRIQFGLLRRDLSPRPSYVALAALGRFLSGARALGRWKGEAGTDVRIHAFRSFPDARERDLLVAWAEREVDWPERGKTTAPWPLSADLPIETVHDFLGRPLGSRVPERLTGSPIYVVLPAGAADGLPLVPPPRVPWREGVVSPIVLQCALPREAALEVKATPWACEFENRVEGGRAVELPIFIYNFGRETARGRVALEHIPEGWTASERSWELALEPLERKRLPLSVRLSEGTGDARTDTWVRLRGEFGGPGSPVLAFRLIRFAGEGYER